MRTNCPSTPVPTSPPTAEDYAIIYRSHDVDFFQGLIDRSAIEGARSSDLAPVIELEARGAA